MSKPLSARPFYLPRALRTKRVCCTKAHLKWNIKKWKNLSHKKSLQQSDEHKIRTFLKVWRRARAEHEYGQSKTKGAPLPLRTDERATAAWRRTAPSACTRAPCAWTLRTWAAVRRRRPPASSCCAAQSPPAGPCSFSRSVASRRATDTCSTVCGRGCGSNKKNDLEVIFYYSFGAKSG